jgi:hypothetical protein
VPHRRYADSWRGCAAEASNDKDTWQIRKILIIGLSWTHHEFCTASPEVHGIFNVKDQAVMRWSADVIQRSGSTGLRSRIPGLALEARMGGALQRPN